MNEALPVDRVLAAIAQHWRDAGVVLLRAPTGSGKTTRVPPYLARAAAAEGLQGELVVLEPRRLAARAAARRVASEHGTALGEFAGYQVRHDKAVSKATRVRFVTEGILVRRCLGDPFLEGVHTVVLDEFHERHLEGDLALAMLREIRDTVRPDLRLVVMSATLAVEPLQQFFSSAVRVDAEGRVFPVETTWLGSPAGRTLGQQVAAAVREAIQADPTGGDVLVFLPGVGEIRACEDSLAGLARERRLRLVPLHGSLDSDQQDLALRPQPERRVILATNVAESSVTVPSVTAVVDTGLARVLRHDHGRGIDSLTMETISLASAEQRRGRAGRTAPGHCYRLWSRADERRMAPHEEPEVRRVDLAGPALMVHAFAARDPATFGWFEAPDGVALDSASRQLEWLGAVEAGGCRVTALGHRMLELPLSPRLARLVMAGAELGCTREAAAAAALVSEADPRRTPLGGGRDHAGPPRDLVDWVRVWCADPRSAGLDRATEQRVRKAQRRYESHRVAGDRDVGARATGARDRGRGDTGHRRGANREGGKAVASASGRNDPSVDEALGRAVLAAFPDRVIRMGPLGGRRARAAEDGTMVGGRGVSFPESLDSALLVAVQLLDVGGSKRSQASLWTAIDEDWLDAAQLQEQVAAEWDERATKVVAVRRRLWGDLVLSEHRGGKAPEDAVRRALEPVLAGDLWRYLGQREALDGLLARVRWLRRRHPELGYPDWGDDEVAAVAVAQVGADGNLGVLQRADLVGPLLGSLPDGGHALRQRAPATLALPSGRKAAVDYGAEAGPTVAGLIQEWFGAGGTPHIDGEPLVIHFLAPNRRPVQVTRDLAGFWERHYPSLRRELGRRYPRYMWPEDPLAARPDQRGIKPRR